MLSIWSTTAQGQDAPKRLRKGQTVRFAAEDGIGPEVLGMGFDRTLSNLGPDGTPMRVYAASQTERDVNRYEARFMKVDNEFEFNGHGRYLLAEVGASESSSNRYMVLRVCRIDKVIQLIPSDAPLGEADMVATKLYYGWAAWIVMEGSASTFTADLAADLKLAGAKLKSSVERSRLQTYVHLVGLEPKADNAVVIATNAEEVLSSFKTAEESQPIYVEYQVLRNMEFSRIPWESSVLKAGKYRLQIEVELQATKANGKGWDVGKDPPDPRAILYISGKEKPISTQKNTYKATFEKTVEISDTDVVHLVVMEADLSEDDYVGKTEPITPVGTVKRNTPYTLTPTGSIKNATLTFFPLE